MALTNFRAPPYTVCRFLSDMLRRTTMISKDTYQVPNIYNDLKTGTKRKNPLVVAVPGSKSITNRALLLATLADGSSLLKGMLFSDDSRHFLKCIQALGFETRVDEKNKTVEVTGLGGPIPYASARQYVGSAGTAARFLTAYLGLSHGVFYMDASEQMRKRPMEPLLDSLKKLGCQFFYMPGYEHGHFPFILRGHGFNQDHINVNIDNSSQFLSALLIASSLSTQDFTTEIEGKHGMAYIEMTIRMMEQFGVTVERPSDNTFLTRAGQHYRAQEYQVEPDVSAACYFYAMCPLLNIPVLVEQVHFDSLQGDVAFIRLLEQMGCNASDTPQGIRLAPPADGVFQGITADMSACSDQAITMAAIAPYAEGPTTITGIGHIRFQESDRLTAMVTELTKMGIHCEADENSITISPGNPTPALVETYDDHRMAMGFSLTGLRSDGIVIKDPGCCRKTFEEYFEVLDETINNLKEKS